MKNWYALQVIFHEIDAFFHWCDNFFLCKLFWNDKKEQVYYDLG